MLPSNLTSTNFPLSDVFSDLAMHDQQEAGSGNHEGGSGDEDVTMTNLD